MSMLSSTLTPLQDAPQAGSYANLNLLREGKCAAVVLAGGEGSRLKCAGPKGCVPISRVKRKTLFQLMAEKVKAASLLVDYPLQLAIMTSPGNRVETETYFIQNAFFGLEPSQLSFFCQDVAPYEDFDGTLFSSGPKGNGGVFRSLCSAGIWEKWHALRVEYVNVLPIDNPLALPFDPELFGFHAAKRCDVALKVGKRRDSQEKVGVVVCQGERLEIVEYFELPKGFEAPIANLGLYSFSMDFINRVRDVHLPLHKAKKAVRRDGVTPKEPNAWKSEEFIFDLFSYASRCEALLYPREEVFAPLKNLEGEDSIASVQAALLAHEQRLYTQITGLAAKCGDRFELSPAFYYPSQELCRRWKGRALPDCEYIEDSA